MQRAASGAAVLVVAGGYLALVDDPLGLPLLLLGVAALLVTSWAAWLARADDSDGTDDVVDIEDH